MTGKWVPYWHVDAFADRPFAGNQAAVMILDEWPKDELLQAIGAENMFAETAFLAPDSSDEADWELRWFTPAAEVAMCGHATLASGHAVLSRDESLGSVRFRTRKAGILEVRRAGGQYELSLPAVRTDSAPPAGIAQGLGAQPEELRYDEQGYVVCRYRDEAAVRALSPDMAQLARHGDTMFICTAPGESHDVVSRVFVPGVGIPEDSVTGSAHAALTVFWAGRLGRGSFTAHQASARGGDLTCRLEDGRVWLGGPCVTVVEGRFYLGG